MRRVGARRASIRSFALHQLNVASAEEAEEGSDEDSDEEDDWDDDDDDDDYDDDDDDYDSGTEEGAAALDDSVCPPGE